MLFSSIPFAFYFLPAVLALYFAVPFRFKNAVLLVFSLVFYAWGEPGYLLLMAVSILLGWLFGLLIGLALVLLAELIYRAVRHFCGVEKHV